MEFTYVALTKDGRKESSIISAPNIATAGHLLKEQGLLPTEIKEKTTSGGMEFLTQLSTIKFEEKINFIDNLGVMLKAGIPISRSLQILTKQTSNPRFKNILSDIHTQVEQGKGLSEAMEKYPTVFPNIMISMVKVGEVSGGLDKSLEYLNIQLHREADLKSKVKGAMIYPSVIIFAMLIIGVLLSIFVLPSLTAIFKDSGSSLPITTKMVIWFADFMSAHAWVVVSVLVIFISGLVSAYRTHEGQKLFDIFSLHFMSINTIVKKINLARFSRILSSMLKSGIPIVQALDVAGESLSNIPYKELIAQAALDVKVGKPLAESLGKNETLFPPLVVQMMEVGEESGAVQEILEQLAVHYEEEVDNTLKDLSSIIEPLLLLFIGGVVGFLAMALIAPIYSIYQGTQ
jgi:type IV pilus assembly protein PilC